MKLGYNTNGFAHHRLEDALSILSEIGYTSVALTLDYQALNPFDNDLSRQMVRVRDLLTRFRMRCVVETGTRFLLDPRRKHQPTLLSAEPDEQGRRLDFLRRSIDIAQTLGADAVSFWSGAADEPAPDAELTARLADACKRLCDYAAAKNVRLAFEPEPGMFIDTMAKFGELHRRLGHAHFGLTLDMGHLHCQGEVPIAEHIHRWKECLWNVHLEDMKRGVHDHLMFGEGEMEFAPIFQALRAINYEGGVHVELSRHSHDAVNIAARALKFLTPLAT